MKIEPIRQEGYELLHEGSLELCRVERNGIRIDMAKMQETKQRLTDMIADLRADLEKDDVWRQWKKRYGPKASLTSRAQLSEIFHVNLEYEVSDLTEGGEAATDEEALSKIDHPFIKPYIRMMKYLKARDTFLKGIEVHVIGDRLFPSFWLHTVRSYRSSSTEPNFQNFPVRDKEISEIIRSQFIASPGCVIVENDFKGIEVGVSGCYNKDENFLRYVRDPETNDMHRDMAAQIYFLEDYLDKWKFDTAKEIRYGAKNKFVFPQFYGDYYVACARNLWEWLEKGKLLGPDGKPLADWLYQNGIDGLGACNPEEKPVQGTFEYHVAQVENDFWNNRFRQYGQWRKDWYKAYLKKGYFDTYTGFRISGFLGRNAVTNYPIQGSAFHCLLWCLIQINKQLRKYNMKSMVVGQIHDSLIGDVRIDELRQYLEIVEEVTTVWLPKYYKWIIVPLEIEYEIAPSNGTWFDKKEIKFKKGQFRHPENKEVWTDDALKFINYLDSKNEKPRYDRALQTL